MESTCHYKADFSTLARTSVAEAGQVSLPNVLVVGRTTREERPSRAPPEVLPQIYAKPPAETSNRFRLFNVLFGLFLSPSVYGAKGAPGCCGQTPRAG